MEEREEEEEEEEGDSRAWWDLPQYDTVFTTTVCISVSLNRFSFSFLGFLFYFLFIFLTLYSLLFSFCFSWETNKKRRREEKRTEEKDQKGNQNSPSSYLGQYLSLVLFGAGSFFFFFNLFIEVYSFAYLKGHRTI